DGRPYMPDMHADRAINEVIFREFAPAGDNPLARRLRAGMKVGLDMMPYARFRPVTFVGQRLWDEQVRAFDLAIRHKATPAEALAASQATVQEELNKVFNRDRYPVLDWHYPLGIVALLVLGTTAAIAWVGRRRPRMGRNELGEAVAGYLFASPWIVGFLVFTAGPIVASLIFSFCDYDVLHPARFVSGHNFASLLSFHDLRVHWLEGLRDAR